MEYIKILAPFIIGILTTPVVESIKNVSLFRKKNKLVRTEITDLLDDISSVIDNTLVFLKDVLGYSYKFKVITIDQLYFPTEIDIVFLRSSLEDLYVRYPKYRRMAIKKILKWPGEIKKCESNILEKGKESSITGRVYGLNELWVLYYTYLNCICNFKQDIRGFMLNEQVSIECYNKSVEKECADRGLDYYFFHQNFSMSKEIYEALKRLPD